MFGVCPAKGGKGTDPGWNLMFDGGCAAVPEEDTSYRKTKNSLEYLQLTGGFEMMGRRNGLCRILMTWYKQENVGFFNTTFISVPVTSSVRWSESG